MVVGTNFIYFELQKTASTQVRVVLSKLKNLPSRKVGIHNPYYSVNRAVLGDFKDKIKFGTIRNPWDWYVSLWIWGCGGQGIYKNKQMPRNKEGLIYFLFHPIDFFQQRKKWNQVYADKDNIKNFKQWLWMMLYERKYEVGDSFAASEISQYSGYLTYHYLRLHTFEFPERSRLVQSYNDLVTYDNEYNFLDYIIRGEHFDKDMRKVLRKLEVEDSEIDNVFEITKGRANSTKRKHYREYYDKESIQWIAEKERFINDKYGYSF